MLTTHYVAVSITLGLKPRRVPSHNLEHKKFLIQVSLLKYNRCDFRMLSGNFSTGLFFQNHFFMTCLDVSRISMMQLFCKNS